jgi:polyisoprenoid-binding protein YceI
VKAHRVAQRASDDHAIHSFSLSVTDLAVGIWRLDAARSSVEFHVRHLYGLRTVKGALRLLLRDHRPRLRLGGGPEHRRGQPRHENAKRDERLRSADFFDVEQHPEVRFISDSVVLDGATVGVRGQLQAAGRRVPLAFEATVRAVDGEVEIEALTHADQ